MHPMQDIFSSEQIYFLFEKKLINKYLFDKLKNKNYVITYEHINKFLTKLYDSYYTNNVYPSSLDCEYILNTFINRENIAVQ